MKFTLPKSFACTILVLISGINMQAQPGSTAKGQTIVNGKPLTEQQKHEFLSVYRVPILPGNYWYDSLSGFWGHWGHEAAGVLNQGHDFGPLAANASNGNTGIFINGRQLNLVEALFFQQILGPLRPGRAWLDGRTGYFGVEGNPNPIGNLAAILQAQRKSKAPLFTEHDINGGSSNEAGTCTKSGNCYYPNR